MIKIEQTFYFRVHIPNKYTIKETKSLDYNYNKYYHYYITYNFNLNFIDYEETKFTVYTARMQYILTRYQNSQITKKKHEKQLKKKIIITRI